MNIDEIINGCKKGDRKSQDQIVRMFAPTLMAVCRRYCYDSNIAQDALQETFINILKYIKGYSGKGSFEGWTRRIAVNCSLDTIKKIRPIHIQDDIDLSQDVSLCEIPAVYSKMGKDDLLKFIKKLPEGQYMVFNMKIIEGYSHQEIATILGIKTSTSRSNLTRARVKLVEMLQHQSKMENIKLVANGR